MDNKSIILTPEQKKLLLKLGIVKLNSAFYYKETDEEIKNDVIQSILAAYDEGLKSSDKSEDKEPKNSLSQKSEVPRQDKKQLISDTFNKTPTGKLLGLNGKPASSSTAKDNKEDLPLPAESKVYSDEELQMLEELGYTSTKNTFGPSFKQKDSNLYVKNKDIESIVQSFRESKSKEKSSKVDEPDTVENVTVQSPGSSSQGLLKVLNHFKSTIKSKSSDGNSLKSLESQAVPILSSIDNKIVSLGEIITGGAITSKQAGKAAAPVGEEGQEETKQASLFTTIFRSGFATFLGIASVLTPLIKVIKSTFTDVLEWFKKVGPKIWDSISSFFTETIPKFFTETLPDFVVSVAKTIFGFIQDNVISAFSTIFSVGDKIVEAVKVKFKELFGEADKEASKRKPKEAPKEQPKAPTTPPAPQPTPTPKPGECACPAPAPAAAPTAAPVPAPAPAPAAAPAAKPVVSEKKPAEKEKQPSGGMSGMAGALAAALDKFGITNPFAKQAVVATAAKESGLNPKAVESGAKAYLKTLKGKGLEYIYKVFPQLKPGGRVAKKLGFDKGVPADYLEAEWSKGDESFFESVYGGLGTNSQAGDAYRYRGRGFIQLTGRAVYDKAGKEVGINLVENPDAVSDDFNTAAGALAGYIFTTRGGKEKALAALNSFKDFDSALKFVLQTVAGLGHKQEEFEKEGSHLQEQYRKASQFQTLAEGSTSGTQIATATQSANIKPPPPGARPAQEQSSSNQGTQKEGKTGTYSSGSTANPSDQYKNYYGVA